MDTSKEFVKMCEEAPKELWNLVTRRYETVFAWRGCLGILVPTDKKIDKNSIAYIIPETLVLRTWLKDKEDLRVIGRAESTDEGTPLYAQDQLQEMIDYTIWFEKIYRFYDWLQKNSEDWETPCTRFTSMEQLWLAFVMSEKYQKKWNGKEWRNSQ